MTTYKLFQVKQLQTRNFGFMGLSIMERMGIDVNLDNYEVTYTGEVADNKPSVMLEELFVLFNTNRPRDFYGRSMSVSDIVEIDGNYYFCDSIGWEKVNHSIPSTQNITIVYYTPEGGHPDAFHVNKATTEKLQEEFDSAEIASIKNITIESESFMGRKYKTLFLEKDIFNFINNWKINF